MEQQRDASAESPPESVDEELGGEGDEQDGITDRYFWVLLVAVSLLAAGGSVGVVYSQYERIDQRVQSSPYVDRLTEMAEAIPYVNIAGDTTASNEGASTSFGTFTELERLIVNPAGAEGTRYLAVSIAFETNSTSVTSELNRRKVVVRDAVLRLLSKRTADELGDPSLRDDLKEVLRKETNSILSSGTVERLYFTEFVLQ